MKLHSTTVSFELSREDVARMDRLLPGGRGDLPRSVADLVSTALDALAVIKHPSNVGLRIGSRPIGVDRLGLLAALEYGLEVARENDRKSRPHLHVVAAGSAAYGSVWPRGGGLKARTGVAVSVIDESGALLAASTVRAGQPIPPELLAVADQFEDLEDRLRDALAVEDRLRNAPTIGGRVGRFDLRRA